MFLQISLDNQQPHYTNLDYIAGKVILRLPSPVSVTSIVVKLEGESRTRLLSPPEPGGRRTQQVEVHKAGFLFYVIGHESSNVC